MANVNYSGKVGNMESFTFTSDAVTAKVHGSVLALRHRTMQYFGILLRQ